MLLLLSQGEPLVLKELRFALTQRARGQLGKGLWIEFH